MLAFKNMAVALGAWARRQLGREALSSLLHVATLLCLVSLLRALFFRGVSNVHYQAPSIFVSLARADLSAIAAGARRHQPIVPEILTFVVPMVLFVLAKRKLRWTDWEHGKSLRIFCLVVVLMLCWSGTTSPFNVYVGRTHSLDRLLLAGCALLSVRFPLFVPIAVRMAIVMIKDGYVPIPSDDFDFRAPAELAVIFAIFVWASFARSFKPAHFLVVGLGSFAAYYYCAGTAKWNFGPPGSWLNENHVSNISVSAHVRGWLSFVPDSLFLRFAGFARKLDYPLQTYTLVVELGALFLVFVSRRLTRFWFLGAFFLNFGIFLMTGICFWKWMTVSLTAFIWMSRSGKPLIDALHRYKLPLLLGVASIYWSDLRIWYFPQTHVVWYDTRFTENYELYAIGKSGKRYLVSPTYLAPMDMHFTQGRLCYASDGERALTGIYATTGSYGTMKALESATPEQAFAMRRRQPVCRDEKLKARYDDFMKRYFGNLNRSGRQLEWLDWVARPRHLRVSPHGELDGGTSELYDGQEQVSKIELWVTAVYHHDSELVRTEPKLTHTVEIPTR